MGMVQVGPADPRFEDLFEPERRTLSEMIKAATACRSRRGTSLSQLQKKLPSLEKRIKQISAMPLEKQLARFAHALSGLKASVFKH